MRVDQARSAFAAAIPTLQYEGWSDDEIRAASNLLRDALEQRDASLLECWSEWLNEKRAPARAMVGVVPVLSDAAEKRIADLKWQAGKDKSR